MVNRVVIRKFLDHCRNRTPFLLERIDAILCGCGCIEGRPYSIRMLTGSSETPGEDTEITTYISKDKRAIREQVGKSDETSNERSKEIRGSAVVVWLGNRVVIVAVIVLAETLVADVAQDEKCGPGHRYTTFAHF